MSLFRERRRYPRTIIEWPVSIRTDQGTMEGVTVNISGGGATVRCQNAPVLHEVCKMTINVPRLSHSLVVDAKVVWSSADISDNELGPPMIGVHFTDIADYQRWLISTAVSILLKHKERAPSRVKKTRKVLEKVLEQYEPGIPEDK